MVTNKVYKIEKLPDTSLEKVSSGLSDLSAEALTISGCLGTLAGMIGGTACSIAGAVYSSKTNKALAKGDVKNAEKYAKTAKGLTIATAALSGVVPICLSAYVVGGVNMATKHPEIATKVLNNMLKNKST